MLLCEVFLTTGLFMELFRTIESLRNALVSFRNKGLEIGLVPTMGALHAGHASLISRSSSENGVTVVSIFLNPTQFNDKRDLERYPRTLDADLSVAENSGADIVFAPSVDEMYPVPDTRCFSYPPTDVVMEGAHRSGHFNGVCQIVSKLFFAVEPNRAYFGEKDFQQIAVVRAMVKDLGLGVDIVSCPVVREPSGLAMSSRNSLLSSSERSLAARIYASLSASIEFARTHSVAETQRMVVDEINAVDGLEVEYFSIVDGFSLSDVTEWDDATCVVGCITVWCGVLPVRLIDHIKYK